MNPTPEQVAICDSTADILKIKAGAGTGKTTTLVHLAQRYPRERILYLAFNKAIKEEALSRFGSNVKAMTAHGMAFAHIGKHYANRPDKLAMSDLRPFHVLPELTASLTKLPKELHNLYGGRVLETVKNYLISGEDELDPMHVSLGMSPGERRHFEGGAILADAAQVWAKMQDLDHKLPMIHDGYLKLFQIRQPDLGYDMLLLDEAQDTNPVTQALVDIQWGRLVYVGDEHQAIYGFRGASNAMALIQADEDHLLTGSFRFGPLVAEVANIILAAKGENNLRLRGLGQETRVGMLPFNAPHAFISRGNAALFARAVTALERNSRFAFVGPLSSYRLDLIEQTYHLMERRPVRDPFLASFGTFEKLEEYADAMEDRDLKSRCNLVNKYRHRIPSLIARIQAKAGTYGQGGPFDQVLTTAHRAKGLEFDHVQLGDDFLDFYDDETEDWRDLSELGARETEEINLQYVAVTRAKKHLEVGDKLAKFLRYQAKLHDSPLLPHLQTEAPPPQSLLGQNAAPRPPVDPDAPAPPNRPQGQGAKRGKSKAAKPKPAEAFTDIPTPRRPRLPKPTERPAEPQADLFGAPATLARGRPGRVPVTGS